MAVHWQASIHGEAQILVEEDVRGTDQDSDIREAECGLEEDIGKGDVILVILLVAITVRGRVVFHGCTTGRPLED